MPPDKATPSARRSIAVPWRERPRDLAAWPAKPAATEVVAHATLSLPQPERVVVGRVRPGGVEGVRIRVVEQRPSRGDCAARNSRAQGAPRCLGSAPPALRAADGLDRASRDPFSGNYRRPQRKCLTTVGGGATVGSSSPAATRSPLHIARCGARSNRRSQATVRSLLLKPLPGRLFVRRHVRETDDRIGLRFGPRPGADPTVHSHVQIITLPRRYACQKSMRREMRSVRPFTVNNSGIDARNGQAYHGRKTTTHERDAAGGTGSALARRTTRRSDDGADASLRAFVRALARQAARECFEAGTEAAIANDSMRCRT